MAVLNEDAATSNANVKAVIEKDAGNLHYKRKEFDRALECYNRAICLDSTNATFYTNKAAVFIEQGEHEKCRETCLKAIDVGRTYKSDPKVIARAFGRIGSSFMKQRKYNEAAEFLKKSLREFEMNDIKEKLKVCKKEIIEQERIAYINPDVSLVERAKGDEALKLGDFTSSLKHYTESIKRNPDNAKIYLSRATVYMHLLMHNEALADCEECVAKDSNFVKGHICKGAALESLGKFDEALDAYTVALELDPSGKEAPKAYFRCIDRDYQCKNTPDAIYERAMKDPDIKEIMLDPEIKQMIEDIKVNPKVAQKSLKNPRTSDKIKTLIEYGLLKLS